MTTPIRPLNLSDFTGDALYCSRCDSDLPAANFGVAANKARSRQVWCKICMCFYQREKKYGLSRLAIEYMLAGGCEACGANDNLCIDHDHGSGRVRGVLCDWCNRALGLLKEDTDTITALLSYVLSNEEER